MPGLEVRSLTKSFAGARLLDGLDLDVAPGEWLAVVGESGSGKSTLLNILAGLELPDSGSVRLDETLLDPADDDAVTLWRRSQVGFVFQAFHLLPYLTVLQNVTLPLALLRMARAEREARAEALLRKVGLAGFASRAPATLSGGEMQRVAIARALAHRPALVLADEPTGNLDAATADRVLAAFSQALADSGAAAVMVTHSAHAAARAHRQVRLRAGRLS